MAVTGNIAHASKEGVDHRLLFFKKLQTLTNKIHGADALDQIMLDVSQDICDLFDCDRLTIYVVAQDKTTLISKIKTGLNSFKDLRLSISEQSIAGHVALTRTMISLRDVYDENELRSHSPTLKFQRAVDQRTGYRTKQMLVAPIVDAQSNELLGVVQFINHRFGNAFTDIAAEGVQALCETLAVAFSQKSKALPTNTPRTKFDFLVSEAIISAQELELAVSSARRNLQDLEDVLTDEFDIPVSSLGQALAKYFNVPYEPFKPERLVPVDLVKRLKRQYVEQNSWLPVMEDQNGLTVLAIDPEHINTTHVVNHVFATSKINYKVTTKKEFRQTIDQFFGGVADTGSVDDLLSGMEDEDEEHGGGQSAVEISAAVENELVKLINKIIIDAYQQGASDIHIEPRPGKEKTLIRFRKDGSLSPYIEIPASYRNSLLARIKIMCDLDISERRKPQDGKIKFKKYGPYDIELRVATIPSSGGMEDVVMRILAAGEPIPLDKLGILPYNLERLKQVVSKPYGLFFVCGPTGSGKTTTLHSVLSHLNTPETKIWTAEDPVEITQKGLRQVQVNRKAGMDFATVMRAFLRADPDIIMVGEMRDKETVAIGLEASLTGHMVLATLHTNSAPESIVRLLDMGMDPFNFADALLGILAQRLTKRLCGKCKVAYHPGKEEMKDLLDEYCVELLNTEAFTKNALEAKKKVFTTWQSLYGDKQGKFTLYKAVGCEHCSNGYKGRLGLHELMVANDIVKKLIQDHARVSELLTAALADGMLTLKMDGIEKVLSGLTDMKQVRIVCIK
ncbi:GspE/PulE family protein [Undibacterium sp. CY18W]|uniref:GspE/PulE family protein n=1 Tax=Undibacterium hunanense TaxID=2762292 RepID=A0ABR6ZQA0_9BURK|nr:GspE/PulE family protein [Undibacterium hunanense]MBC3918071.1 GspE/PulE family protein [Undibacterium hunanense]